MVAESLVAEHISDCRVLASCGILSIPVWVKRIAGGRGGGQHCCYLLWTAVELVQLGWLLIW